MEAGRFASQPDSPELKGTSIGLATRPFSFDGDSAAFQLTCEAKRIDLAFLFDPMMAAGGAPTKAERPVPALLNGTRMCNRQASQ
jgi:hypothetical protein